MPHILKQGHGYTGIHQLSQLLFRAYEALALVTPSYLACLAYGPGVLLSSATVCSNHEEVSHSHIILTCTHHKTTSRNPSTTPRMCKIILTGHTHWSAFGVIRCEGTSLWNLPRILNLVRSE
ncbi:hypothetical protein CY34DRAFT_199984 [Suillus luteus UH-Slu-Lm8-n1]|uniref:Uncharacterized protein n=1 Tax=Suillus luteus UH-Slu-Lm8-n1 TaxID=930992 RepID=A0A0D0B4Z6_9AGAM|nr:hypothetical protein CY34DRAFT_199984 [Suillus luteus UH-Slu-Lm8-n1]